MDEQPVTREEITRAQTGDRAAFGEICARCRPRLEALVTARLGHQLEARAPPEDIVQEILTRALESLDRFRWAGEDSFFRWLAGIAENVFRGEARRSQRAPLLRIDVDRLCSEPHPSRMLRREERFDRLEKALGDLTPEQREAIVLMRIHGLKIREIAERTGRSETAVKQLLLRALRRLRKRFGDTESLGLPDRRLEPSLKEERDDDA